MKNSAKKAQTNRADSAVTRLGAVVLDKWLVGKVEFLQALSIRLLASPSTLWIGGATRGHRTEVHHHTGCLTRRAPLPDGRRRRIQPK